MAATTTTMDDEKVAAALATLKPLFTTATVVKLIRHPDADAVRCDLAPGEVLFTWGEDDGALMLPDGRLDIGGGSCAPTPGEDPLYDAMVVHNAAIQVARSEAELAELEQQFAAAGGRGVDLADRIDRLRDTIECWRERQARRA